MRETESTERQSLEAILGDFNLSGPSSGDELKSERPVTLWVSADHQAKFNRLQNLSEKRFGKRAKKALCMLIDMAYKLVPKAS